MAIQLPKNIFAGTAALMLVAVIQIPGFALRDTDMAQAAKKILVERCSNCHGNVSPPQGINVLSYPALKATGVLKNDGSSHSLVRQVETGAMPLGGSKLSAGEIGALKGWIAAGAPGWDDPSGSKTGQTGDRKRVDESETLKAIVQDLRSADERKRPYLRYFSLVNLYNNAEVSGPMLDRYRSALGKLCNSLSWQREIAQPAPIDVNRVILRVDLRDFEWSPQIWQQIVGAYPYGVTPRGIAAEAQRIQDLSGASVPYIRVDWFIATASLAPLYNQILQLPTTVTALETKLGVDSARDVEEETVLRAGVRDSGVSHNNRVVERHRALYGAYWKSFDFADNVGEHNIFTNPLSLHPAGGEFIFNLPNGLQAYFLAKGTGEALSDGPTSIVRDLETNRDDPVVHNGRSCIACHFQGMRHIRDEVRPLLTDDKKDEFDVGKARALYVSQDELDKWLNGDSRRFQQAVTATGSETPDSPAQEPINLIATVYASQLTVAQAASDAGLPVHEFQHRISGSTELRRLGYDQLVDAAGGIKRDAWEEHFHQMAEAIGISDSSAAHPIAGAAPASNGTVPANTTSQSPITVNARDGAEMVYIAPGEFAMGDDDLADNPRHTVRLSGYRIYKNLVTVAQYKKFCRATERPMPQGPAFDPTWSQDDHPMVNVTWQDAMSYANWVGGALPTEAQWERAARGTDGRRYPWGNDFNSSLAWCSKVGFGDAGGTAAVGAHAVSPCGCTDMAGNVWQWCRDAYDENFCKPHVGEVVDPENRGGVNAPFHTLRGGSWFSCGGGYFRTGYRSKTGPLVGDFGFRCVVTGTGR